MHCCHGRTQSPAPLTTMAAGLLPNVRTMRLLFLCPMGTAQGPLFHRRRHHLATAWYVLDPSLVLPPLAPPPALLTRLQTLQWTRFRPRCKAFGSGRACCSARCTVWSKLWTASRTSSALPWSMCVTLESSAVTRTSPQPLSLVQCPSFDRGLPSRLRNKAATSRKGSRAAPKPSSRPCWTTRRSSQARRRSWSSCCSKLKHRCAQGDRTHACHACTGGSLSPHAPAPGPSRCSFAAVAPWTRSLWRCSLQGPVAGTLSVNTPLPRQAMQQPPLQVPSLLDESQPRPRPVLQSLLPPTESLTFAIPDFMSHADSSRPGRLIYSQALSVQGAEFVLKVGPEQSSLEAGANPYC